MAWSPAVSLVMQTVTMGAYLPNWERGQLTAIPRDLRSAFTLQKAASVRAIGQIELIFAILASAVIFREATRRLELAEILLIGGSILILILSSA